MGSYQRIMRTEFSPVLWWTPKSHEKHIVRIKRTFKEQGKSMEITTLCTNRCALFRQAAGCCIIPKGMLSTQIKQGLLSKKIASTLLQLVHDHTGQPET